MTKLMERAVETVRRLSPEMQDDLARVLLQLAGEDQPVIQLCAEEEASFDESLAQADRGMSHQHQSDRKTPRRGVHRFQTGYADQPRSGQMMCYQNRTT
jgi:hypothetical protein